MAQEQDVIVVGRKGRSDALRFLLAGAAADELADTQVAVLEQMLGQRRQRGGALWLARRGPRTVAAAMVVALAGRIGMLLHCPPGTKGVDKEALIDLIRRLTADRLAAGRLHFVQRLVAPQATAEADVLAAAGYEQVAELVYMRLDLAAAAAQSEPDGQPLRMCTVRRAGRRRMQRVIAATYVGSLDCPRIAAARPMRDVLAAHRATGTYRPAWWWVAQSGGQDVGCVLVNDSHLFGVAEVVYAGVTPAHRGRGLMRRMLLYAARQLRAAGREALTLAVASRNVYALRVYERMGFARTDRRRLYVRLGGSRRAAEGAS